MDMNKHRNWLIRKAEQEDGCFVSVGGLVGALEQRKEPDERMATMTEKTPEQIAEWVAEGYQCPDFIRLRIIAAIKAERDKRAELEATLMTLISEPCNAVASF